ncbi:hypothetical protein QT196_00180 [Streptomyces sp. P9-2B-2]|uniref:hypothetical protein n=1 Tax=Streptomyces sp. P9-2B-2 TaxID=3057114 RepID=UPI0025B5BA0F|nr:hypothetical protein [Streptomyces sp. P9-2B-2]WJY35821.1 hypothetical protein QT196_00180 [Streptomyces sp. P9-2B-2]
MSPSPIERVLAKARLEDSTYSPEDIEAAERRIATRVADRLLHGALSFDDAMKPARAQTVRTPSPGCAAWQPEEKLRNDAAGALRALCRSLVGQADALHQMATFVGHRILDPDGAVILGCVLQLAARDDSARFWWQFAAGAGEMSAACCLYLHHLSLGETPEADWWRTQMMADSSVDPAPGVPEPAGPGWEGVPWSSATWTMMAIGLEDSPPTATVTWKHMVLPQAAAAVVSYVPTAIEYVDDVELPLPTAGFAERIEELTAHA